MGFELLRGSLSKNILDLTKSAGCPAIPLPFKNHSVIRYFSRMQSTAVSAKSGVVGDGGWYFLPDPLNMTSFNYYANINLNAKFPFTALVTFGDNVEGENNYLNICNQKEFISYSDYSNTIQNIEKADDIIEADMDGYFNYYLYRPNYTQDIIIAGTDTPVSKTAELMEFVYLHAQVPKCKTGELYIEIENFEITGTITNDHFIYVYYWETLLDSSTIEGALSDDDHSGTYPYILDTNNLNAPVKIMNLSDLQGEGTNKKLVIWLDRLKTPGERLAVHVAIGFKPQDFRKDNIGYNSVAKSTDLPSDIIFKFKKAIIKIDKTKNNLIGASPLPFPDFGYKDLLDDTYANWATYPHLITIPMQYMTSAGNVGPDAGLNTITSLSYPNGGAQGDNLGWYSALYGYQASPNYLSSAYFCINEFTNGAGKTSIETIYEANVLHSVTMLKFYQVSGQEFNDSETYRIKLPWLGDPHKFKVNTTSFLSPDDFEFKVFAGSVLETASGDYWPLYQDLIDSLVLLGTFTASELTGGFITMNSGSALTAVGSPFAGIEEGLNKDNYARYCEFSGSLIPSVGRVCFYIAMSKVGEDFRDLTYAVSGTEPLPTGYNDTLYQKAGCQIKPQYAIDNHFSSYGGVFINYDSMIYQAPQIIDITAQPTAEKYFT